MLWGAMDTSRLPSVIQDILSYRRKRRVAFMLSHVSTKEGMNVIDIGCGPNGRSFDDFVPADWSVTGVDILPAAEVHHAHPNFTYVERDAQHLDCFAAHAFDLAVSIGMLEHVTDEPSFNRVVSQIRRVAKQYVVVVPYRYGWIEPHFGVPWFALLPYAVQVALVKAFNLSNARESVQRDRDYLKKQFRWLSNAEYQAAFTDATIYVLPTCETIAITRRCPL
ncbi:MAG: class I SAM-dependent methyltransferase [Casimicrobiaceae bacterium]